MSVKKINAKLPGGGPGGRVELEGFLLGIHFVLQEKNRFQNENLEPRVRAE